MRPETRETLDRTERRDRWRSWAAYVLFPALIAIFALVWFRHPENTSRVTGVVVIAESDGEPLVGVRASMRLTVRLPDGRLIHAGSRSARLSPAVGRSIRLVQETSWTGVRSYYWEP